MSDLFLLSVYFYFYSANRNNNVLSWIFSKSEILEAEISIKLVVLLIMLIGIFSHSHLVDQHLIDQTEELRIISRTNFLIHPLFIKFFAVFGFHV